MYARVATYEVPDGRMDEAAARFAAAAQKVQELDGLEGGVILVGEEGKLMTITLWASRSALEASETRAGLARREAVASVDGDVRSVESYEVGTELVPLAKLAAEAEAAKAIEL